MLWFCFSCQTPANSSSHLFVLHSRHVLYPTAVTHKKATHFWPVFPSLRNSGGDAASDGSLGLRLRRRRRWKWPRRSQSCHRRRRGREGVRFATMNGAIMGHLNMGVAPFPVPWDQNGTTSSSAVRVGCYPCSPLVGWDEVPYPEM